MNILETLRIGLAGITANKLRSGLTMLGILIGVAAVIVLVAVGNGSSKAVTDRIASLGSNTLTVRSGSFGFGGGDGARTQYKGLSVADAEALLDDVLAPDVSSVSPVSTTSLTCTYDGTSYDTSITGTWPSYFEASNSAVAEGSYFDDADVNSSRRVAVIGQGYVGLPVAIRAVEVGFDVVGFELDAGKVDRLSAGHSHVEDIDDDRLSRALATGRYRPTSEPEAMSGFDVRYNRLFYKGKKLVKKEPFFWAYNSLTAVVCGEKPKDKN